MKFRDRLEKIKKATLTKPYFYYFIFIFLVYIINNIFVNKIYITAPLLFTFNLNIIIPFLFFSILVGLLVAMNLNLVILKFKELRQINKESGFTFVGIFGGLLGGACPSCFVGLFPAFIGLFGVTATLSSLPFFGIEILIVSAGFLLISIFLLTRDNTCRVEVKKGGKK